MPAVRPRAGGGIIQQLNASAPTRAANNALPITAYYRGCDLLLSQARVYRTSGNEEQLYVMLMRYASLVIETIPKHAQYPGKEVQPYKRYHDQVFEVMKELEQLRVALTMHNVQQPTARTLNRPSDAAQLVTSNLPEIDWGSVGASTNGAVVATGSSAFGAEAADWLARVSSGAAAGSSGAGAGAGAVVSVASGSSSSSGGSFSGASGSYQSAYVPSSQHSLDKHALFAAKTLSGRTAVGPAAQAPRPRYPGFDATPAAAIDLLWLPQKQQQQQPQDGSPSAPPEAALARLELAERRSSGAAAGSLLDAPMAPHPSAGPSLGPQEVPVHSMDASSAHPGGTCAQAAVPPAGQLSVVEPGGGAGGLKPLEKRLEMRDVHVSVALMNDFLHYASTNTSRGIESCGILAGTLSAGDSIFRVTTLIIPKQEGTTDTVAALNEEEIYEAQASRELYPLGWIHTHPTQTCFLSSVDVHTQCGYQTMLDEAVAIVMAPRDSRNKCGIFRLTAPGGLQLIQKCPLRGFHAHPPTATGQEVYELCGHVFLNPRTKHQVLDLR